MKVFFIVILLVSWNICHVESNFWKCLNVTETDSTTTTATFYNYTELANNIIELESNITSQLDYLQGNETDLNQSIADLIANITTILNDQNVPDNVAEALLNYRQAIQNISTSNSSARRKRQISSVLSTPCLETSNALQVFQNDIDNRTAQITQNKNNANVMRTATDTFKKAVKNDPWITPMQKAMVGPDKLYSNIENTLNTIKSMRIQQKANFSPISDAVCKLNLGPCGTFASYNPITNPNAPVGRAFSAGTYLDGTAAYVGRANLTFPDTIIPGRCTTSGNLQGPGIYVVSFGEKHLTDSVAYLENHYALTWVSVNKDIAVNTPNAIKIKGEGDSNGYLIGRYNLTSANSTQYTQVAKVHIDNGFNNLWYGDTNQKGQPADKFFEVLTCETTELFYTTSRNDLKSKALTSKIYRLADSAKDYITSFLLHLQGQK